MLSLYFLLHSPPMQITKHNYHLILASNSPRRKELLAGIDVEFDVRALPDIDESFPESLPHEEIAGYLSKKKATSYRGLLKECDLLITADTIVLLDDMILGKPVDEEDARRMLRLLSDQTHRVITGVSLTSLHKQVSFSDTSLVTFGKLHEEEIGYYVERYRPMDKAGAYGVQDWIGYMGVKRIEGSYYNVMGLPIFKVYRELQRF